MPKGGKGIEVWVRVRPTKTPDKGFIITPDEGKVEFKFTKDALQNMETRQEYYGF